jgi:2-polyprenyl-3-methyl-5-hydroxy-6-metoxy-1,4-benzoquinol methylase
VNYREFYQRNATHRVGFDPRLEHLVQETLRLQPGRVLDVGCGSGLVIKRLLALHRAEYVGVDVQAAQDAAGWSYVGADITRGLPFPDARFDCVLLGEVIEHVPDPDHLLREARRVLQPRGHVVVTTPNLVSWANRVLVPLGVQPLYTETSTVQNLGRYLRLLGQGGKVQGHLKVFTHRSLREILEISGFQVRRRRGTPFFFPFPLSLLDRWLCRFPPFASGLLYVAQKRSTDGAAFV